MSRPFLTAQWRNLFLVTYAVPPSLLAKRVPAGLELDTRDGKAFVSLVAFEFLDTRVFGIGWPGYRDFAELNLRYYVRRGSERGVVFLREFVPQRLVAWIANWFYNEPYLAAPLTANRQESATQIRMTYTLRYAGRDHRIAVTGNKPAFQPTDDTIEHFFKEHHWGFGITRKGKLLRYEVSHPVWDVYPVEDYRLDFDYGVVYGSEWAFLAQAAPVSTILACGSAVSVFPQQSRDLTG